MWIENLNRQKAKCFLWGEGNASRKSWLLYVVKARSERAFCVVGREDTKFRTNGWAPAYSQRWVTAHIWLAMRWGQWFTLSSMWYLIQIYNFNLFDYLDKSFRYLYTIYFYYFVHASLKIKVMNNALPPLHRSKVSLCFTLTQLDYVLFPTVFRQPHRIYPNRMA